MRTRCRFLEVSNLKRISKTRQVKKNDDECRLFKQSKNILISPNNHYAIKTYVEEVEKYIEQRKIFTPRKVKPKLSKDEKVALNDLSKGDDIIITNASKGSAVVTVDLNDYVRKPKHQLNNSKNYKVLAEDPRKSINR